MLCRIYRWMAASCVDRDSPLGPGTHRHLSSCPVCRRYYQSQQGISDALKRQAAQVTLPASHLLSDRIMALVPQNGPGRRHHPHVFRLTTYRTIAACLLVALAVLIPLKYTNRSGTDGPDPSLSDLNTMATLLQQVVPEQLMSADTLLVRDSLKSEFYNLSTDAEKAVRFLVQCTPSHGSMGAGKPSD